MNRLTCDACECCGSCDAGWHESSCCGDPHQAGLPSEEDEPLQHSHSHLVRDEPLQHSHSHLVRDEPLQHSHSHSHSHLLPALRDHHRGAGLLAQGAHPLVLPWHGEGEGEGEGEVRRQVDSSLPWRSIFLEQDVPCQGCASSHLLCRLGIGILESTREKGIWIRRRRRRWSRCLSLDLDVRIAIIDTAAALKDAIPTTCLTEATARNHNDRFHSDMSERGAGAEFNFSLLRYVCARSGPVPPLLPP